MTLSKTTSVDRAEIGNRIRELRQVLGLTQERLAAKLGVTFPTVNRWENKHTRPSPLAMEKIEALEKQAAKAVQGNPTR